MQRGVYLYLYLYLCLGGVLPSCSPCLSFFLGSSGFWFSLEACGIGIGVGRCNCVEDWAGLALVRKRKQVRSEGDNGVALGIKFFGACGVGSFCYLLPDIYFSFCLECKCK